MSEKLITIRQNRDLLKAELEEAGAKFKGSAILCPFHEDHKPSGGIYQGKDGAWRFKCQSCGIGGDIFDMRARRTGRPLAEILLEAIGQNQSHRPWQNNQSAQQQSPTGCRVYPDMYSLRSALPGQIVSDHPYRSGNGQVEMIVFRCRVNDDKSYRPAYPVPGGFVLGAPPKPWPIYARDLIVASDTIIIVEGEKCCDALIRFGIAATTSPFGSGKGEHSDWTPLAGKNVILWPDNDITGHNHMKLVCGILETLKPLPRIAWLFPADLDLAEKEDAADFIAQLDGLEKTEAEITTELHAAIGKAKPLGPLDKLHRRMRAIISGEYHCVSWPWSVLTDLTKALLPGTITLLAGTVGASKSFMLLQAVLYWLDESESVAYYCLEGDRPFHLSRAMAQLSGLSGWTDPGWLKETPLVAEASLKEHREQLELFARHLWCSDNLGAETLEQLAEWIERQAKLGRRIIAVDPITAATRTAQPWIADLAFLRAAKKILTEYGCSLVLVTHPQKNVYKPDLTNLAGSAAYERFVEVILTLHSHELKTSIVKSCVGRADVEHTRTIRIEKARNGRGTGCSLAYEFDLESLTLKELGIIMKSTG